MIRYKTTTLNGKPILTHRKVWILANGPIPDGHHIHHINGDRFDNRLENLECVCGKKHTALHFIGHIPWNKGTKYGNSDAYARSLDARRETNRKKCAEAYRLWKSGLRIKEVANRLGIVQRQVYSRLRLHERNSNTSD